jgi:hypothetical protein
MQKKRCFSSITTYWLLVKPGTPEQHHSGTLKFLNLLKIRKKNTGVCENIGVLIIA